MTGADVGGRPPQAARARSEPCTLDEARLGEARWRPYFKFVRSVGSSDFSNALARRVEAYFTERGISRRADAEMIVKTILGLSAWVGTYAWLLLGGFSPAGIVVMYVVHGLAQLFIGLNIAHDANHDAYSRNKTVNRCLRYVFDLVGMSSYMWRFMHNDAHHYFVNIRGADSALESGGAFRYTPHDPHRRFHRYQHLYAMLAYWLPTLDWVLAKDYRWLLSGVRYGNRIVLRHSRSEVCALLAGKGFYYAYTLIVPYLYLEVGLAPIVTGFVVMHAILGSCLALTFQPNHFTATSSFPEADDHGHIHNDYVRHILDNTADYSRTKPWVSWVIGGLNLHVVHHMFPRVCHTHYPALTRILRETAAEFGVPYRENRTLPRAFLAHLRWIRALGREAR